MKTKRTPPADLETIMPLLIGVWRRFHKLSGPSDVLQTREFRSVVEAIKKLHAHENLPKNYFEDRELLGASLLYDFVLHYAEGLSLIGELPTTPKRVLDVCSGISAFGFAALRHGSEEVFATDQNGAALQLSAEVIGRYGLSISTRKWDCLNKPLQIDGTFDLITLGHSLNELFPSNQKGYTTSQEKFIEMLLSRLNPDGFLLLVENSYQEGNRRLLELRDRLVVKGVPIQAPCVWKGACPALKTPNSPCYAQREFIKPYLIKEIQRATNIKLSSIKMSYIIFKHPNSAWPEIEENNAYRVISPPIELHQSKKFYLCGTDGKKTLESSFKTTPSSAKAFDYLKRGELIAIHDAAERGNAFDIEENTKLKVIAACGKPLPHENSEEW